MEYFTEFLETFWNLSLMIGLYVLIGLVFVALLHLYISDAWIEKHLGKESRYAALKGALYGIPLPLCSCGVIPLASSLRKRGASKKAVTSFFITTPMTGVDSIIATYGVFGLPMALIRVISSLISGIVAGTFVKESREDLNQEESQSCCATSCCSTQHAPKKSKLQEALHYALHEVFSDLAKPMFYGLLLATLFMMFVPASSVNLLNEYTFLAYILVFLLALPLYVCSISAIPLALSMLSLGITPGVAFIFLAAAPATNIITAGVIHKILGSDVLKVYLASIISVTLAFALLIDFALPLEWFSYVSQVSHTESSSLVERLGALLFLGLLLFFLLRKISLRKIHTL